MTPEQAMVAVREVEVRHPAIADLRIEAQFIYPELVIRVSWSAPDRDTGRPDNFQRFSRMKVEKVDATYVHGEIEALVREVFNHEFQECFHLRGRRVYESHQVVVDTNGVVAVATEIRG